MRPAHLTLCLLAALSLSCGQPALATQVVTPPSETPVPAATATSPPALPSPTAMATAPERSCEDWSSWPVVPAATGAMRELFRQGQQRGQEPRAFSKIGDGEISAAWFLAAFDLGPSHYDLGPYGDLQAVIDHFQGSFERSSAAARPGFNTERIVDPARSDPSLCEAGEPPLDCELRLHRPAFAILSLGTNQVWRPEEFEAGLRRIVEALLREGIVPILSTKGDNLEGDHRINRTIACLAAQYDLPLWNFWAAIQPLPGRGLQPDLEHLTYGIPDFDDGHAMQSAWTVRNLTALQALDSVWRGVSGP